MSTTGKFRARRTGDQWKIARQTFAAGRREPLYLHHLTLTNGQATTLLLAADAGMITARPNRVAALAKRGLLERGYPEARTVVKLNETGREVAAALTVARQAESNEKLAQAKGLIDEVLQDYPEQAHGSAWLQQALELVGAFESEIESVEGESTLSTERTGTPVDERAGADLPSHVHLVERDTGDGDGLYAFVDLEQAREFAARYPGAIRTEEVLLSRAAGARFLAATRDEEAEEC